MLVLRREPLEAVRGKSPGLRAHKPPAAQIRDGRRPDTEAGRVVGLILPTRMAQLTVGILKAETIHRETFTR